MIVVGGGPAGIVAAGRAAERGRRVALLERGPSLGRKLLLTGGGRCNVTNAAPLQDMIKAYGRHGGFLRNALQAFGNVELIEWLAAHGVPTVEEGGGDIFPASGGAQRVLSVLAGYLEEGGVTVRLGQRVLGLRLVDGVLDGVVVEPEQIVRGGSVLIATGGLSYPATGSTGDGYDLARQAGHNIVPTYPAVGGLESVEGWPLELQGTPTGAIALAAISGAKRVLARASGECMWTHYGISGPAVLDVSEAAVRALRAGDEVSLELDLLPGTSEREYEDELLRSGSARGRQMIESVLASSVPRRTAAVLMEQVGVPPKKLMSQCSREERKRLAALVKHLRLRVARPRPIEEATATGGGVALSEVDPRRMESRLVPGLHFAGEVLDIQGPCGGYNLQAAFATGWLAAESIEACGQPPVS